jgi:hypothetical protein
MRIAQLVRLPILNVQTAGFVIAIFCKCLVVQCAAEERNDPAFTVSTLIPDWPALHKSDPLRSEIDRRLKESPSATLFSLRFKDDNLRMILIEEKANGQLEVYYRMEGPSVFDESQKFEGSIKVDSVPKLFPSLARVLRDTRPHDSTVPWREFLTWPEMPRLEVHYGDVQAAALIPRRRDHDWDGDPSIVGSARAMAPLVRVIERLWHDAISYKGLERSTSKEIVDELLNFVEGVQKLP